MSDNRLPAAQAQTKQDSVNSLKALAVTTAPLSAATSIIRHYANSDKARDRVAYRYFGDSTRSLWYKMVDEGIRRGASEGVREAPIYMPAMGGPAYHLRLKRLIHVGHKRYRPSMRVGVLAHELGHAASRADNSKLFAPVRALGQPAMVAGALTAGLTTDRERGRKAGLIGSLAMLPTIASEINASRVGSQIMRKTLTPAQLRRFGRFSPYLGVATYLMGGALPYATYKVKDRLGYYHDGTEKRARSQHNKLGGVHMRSMTKQAAYQKLRRTLVKQAMIKKADKLVAEGVLGAPLGHLTDPMTSLFGAFRSSDASRDPTTYSNKHVMGALIPGVRGHRWGRRMRMVTDAAGSERGKKQLLADLLGRHTSKGALVALSMLGGRPDIGYGVGTNANALAAIAAAATKRRSIADQRQADDTASLLAKYLAPGKANYDHYKRLGASRNLIEAKE